jgi:hypothetical protein
VCYLLNHTYNSIINGVPLNHLTGTTVDISVMLRFHFWQRVYYNQIDPGFRSESVEACSHIVGISDHCGHAMTSRVLTAETNKVISRSVLRPAYLNDCNLCAELFSGEDTNTIPIFHSRENDDTIRNADQPISRSFIYCAIY